MPTYSGLIGFQVRDERGKETWITNDAEITFTDVADLQNAVFAVMDAIDAPLSGRLIDSKVELHFGASAGVKSAPQAGSSVREGALIGFQDTTGDINGLYFPTLTSLARYSPDESGELRILKLDDSEVEDLLAVFMAGANISGSASFDFRNTKDRKYQPYSGSVDAKYGRYTQRKK